MKIFEARNIPNIITIVRILILFPIIFFIFFNIQLTVFSFSIDILETKIDLNFLLAGILFLISALTDALDGYLARKQNWISQFGKIWDPIADKVIINCVIIALAIEFYVPFYIPIILILRDTIVDAYRLVAIKEKKDVAANIWGKIKTFFLFTGILIILLLFNFSNNSLIANSWQYYILQTGILHVGVILAIFSGIFYIKNFSQLKN